MAVHIAQTLWAKIHEIFLGKLVKWFPKFREIETALVKNFRANPTESPQKAPGLPQLGFAESMSRFFTLFHLGKPRQIFFKMAMVFSHQKSHKKCSIVENLAVNPTRDCSSSSWWSFWEYLMKIGQVFTLFFKICLEMKDSFATCWCCLVLCFFWPVFVYNLSYFRRKLQIPLIEIIIFFLNFETRKICVIV